MPRAPRLEQTNGLYYLMNRAPFRRMLFEGEEDYQYFLELLGRCADQWKLTVHAFCLLPNQYHLLLRTRQAGLSRAMRDLNGCFAAFRRRIHGGTGPLFRSRYKAVLLEENPYLREMVRLIHRRPLRGPLALPYESYLWSSHRLYLDAEECPGWLDPRPVMRTGNPALTRESYRRWVACGESASLISIFESYRWPSVLGSEGFLKSAGKRDVIAREQARPEHEELLRKRISELAGESWEKILTPRSRAQRETRRLAMWLFRRIFFWDYRRLGQEFRISSSSHISRLFQAPLLPHHERWYEQIESELALGKSGLGSGQNHEQAASK